jgi:hypothetical protein
VGRDPRAVVEEYFERVRAGDRGVARLFRERAVIRGLGIRHCGRSNIERFYDQTLEEKRPAPQLLGPLWLEGEQGAEGGRVIAELSIAVSDGPPVHVLDLFDIEDGQIQCLTYFMADYPGEEPDH